MHHFPLRERLSPRERSLLVRPEGELLPLEVTSRLWPTTGVWARVPATFARTEPPPRFPTFRRRGSASRRITLGARWRQLARCSTARQAPHGPHGNLICASLRPSARLPSW